MKCLCCRKKRYEKNDCPLWKQHSKHGNKNFQPKVGVNVVIVEQCIPPFVATQSQQLKEHEEAKIMSKNSPTKGRRMKWDHEKVIHKKLVSEIQ